MTEKAARLLDMKRRGEKIAVLTAYDAPTARAEHEAGIDLILVGDSVGTTVRGYADERAVTLDDIVHHVRAVRRGAPEATVLADLPYATYDTPETAVASARRLVEAGADMVKFEGAQFAVARALAAAGIAASGHLGLECQHHDERRLKAKTAAAALKAIAAATIGIGAGRGTDGQVLVIHDILGLNKVGYRHNRRFAELGGVTEDAARAFAAAVRDGSFPTEANVFAMPKSELALMDDRS